MSDAENTELQDEAGTSAETADRAIANGAPDSSEPTPLRRQDDVDDFDGAETSPLQAAAGVGLALVVAWLLWRFRLRRRPQTPAERLTSAGKTLGAASVAYGGRAASRVSDAAGPAAERTGELAREAGAKAAQAGKVAAGAGIAAAQTGQRVGQGIAEFPGAVADRVDSVHRTWNKWMRRLTIAFFGSIGYVLGARAGRERYEQIAEAARTLAQRPEVQQARDRVEREVRDRTGSAGSSAD